MTDPAVGAFASAWIVFVGLCRLYSMVITPIEFAFFRDDIDSEFFLVSELITSLFFIGLFSVRVVSVLQHYDVEFRFSTFRSLLVELVGCMTWLLFYYPGTNSWIFTSFPWVRVFWIHHVLTALWDIERRFNIRNRNWTVLKLLFIELYFAHVVGCFLYHLAAMEDDPLRTWLGNLTLGQTSYLNFKGMRFWRVYTVSTYFATITLATVGYGGIHPVNEKEMWFVRVLVLVNILVTGRVTGSIGTILTALKRVPPPKKKIIVHGFYIRRRPRVAPAPNQTAHQLHIGEYIFSIGVRRRRRIDQLLRT